MIFFMKMLNNLTSSQKFLLLFVVSFILILSAYVLEHYFNALPCRMCWWQRYVHWGLAGLAALALVVRCYKPFALAALGASLAGLFIAVWQMGGQYKWWTLPEFCQGDAELKTTLSDLSTAFATLPPRCDEVNFAIFGFSLAEWNIPAMLLTALLSYMILKNKK